MTQFAKYFFTANLIFQSLLLPGQELIPLGTWRTHIAYNRANHITIANNRIYCITENGLFYFDKTDNSLGTLSKVNGLSDVIITAIGNGEDGSLMMGYDNGNIDILKGTNITNFTGIRDTPSNFARHINDIVLYRNMAFLAIDYGVIVYDLEKNEIFETWRDLGKSGESLAVYAITIMGDTIYAATAKGIISGKLSPEVNLVDYTQWKRYTVQEGIPEEPATHIVSFNNEILTTLSERYLYSHHGSNWQMIKDYETEKIVAISASRDFASIVKNDGIELMNGNYQFTGLNDPLILMPKYCLPDEEGKLWIADGLNGLVTNQNGAFANMYPDGPFFNAINSIQYKNDKIIILPFGISNANQPLRNSSGFSVFTNGKWENYNNSGARNQFPGPTALDLVDVDYDQKTGNMVFASFGYGIVQWNGEKEYSIIDENSPGSLLKNSNSAGKNTLVSSISIDNSAKIDMINFNTQEPFISINSTGNWKAYNIPYNTVSYIMQLLATSIGNIWMRVVPSLNEGIIVYNENSGQSRAVSADSNQGGLPGQRVNDMAMDLHGLIWVATDKGVAYFPFPDEVISDPELNAIVPLFDNRYLLRGENITCIAVDGGNNKWVGTSEGAWLFNEDGSKLLANFNSMNSPLLSDEINDIGINDKTGEVFFSTSKGLISFRGTATEASPETNIVKIFPNPVPPDYTGIVGIEGLAAGSIVKITDINGKLIYETISEGGMASWNLLDPSGRKAATGVYLVYCATPEGNNAFVGKLAVIR